MTYRSDNRRGETVLIPIKHESRMGKKQKSFPFKTLKFKFELRSWLLGEVF